MQDFHNLKVWQKAHALTLAVYQVTATFPHDERFGLTIQLRRVATLIPTGIADGCGRTINVEFHKALSGAMGAGSQLEYLNLLARDLGFLLGDKYDRLNADVIEVKRMLAGLMGSLND
jgi:four helix bundle protein